MLSCDAAKAVPPMPTQTPIENIEIGPDGALYAMTAWFGVYRKYGDRPWTKVIGRDDLAAGRIFKLPDGSLVITAFNGNLNFGSKDNGLTWNAAGNSSILPGLGKLDAWAQPRFLARTRRGKVFALADGALLKSIDGGKTWISRDLPLRSESNDLERQALAAGDNEVFVLLDGELYRSVDDGRTWKLVKQSIGSPLAIGDGVMPWLRIGLGGKLLAVRRVAKHQTLFTSIDGGRTWVIERFAMAKDSSIDVQLYDLSPDSAYLFLSGGEGGKESITSVYRYAPGRPLVELGFNPSLIRRIIESPQGKLYLLDMNGESIYQSNDGGKNWTMVSRDGISP